MKKLINYNNNTDYDNNYYNFNCNNYTDYLKKENKGKN